MLISFLVLCVGLAAGYYVTYDRESGTEMLQNITALTQIPSASLSVAWSEPRIRLYENAENPAYPQMQPIDRMDFVYAK